MGDTITPQQWDRIDQHLSRRELLVAVRLYWEVAECSLADAKAAVGIRFRERYPELWSNHDQGLDNGRERS